MECTSQWALNQRVERVTTDTLVVGIDIAKDFHVAQAATCRVVLSRHALRVSNSAEGFAHLLAAVRRWQATYQLSDVIVGMESTGHYWLNLAHWLTDHGLEVVLVNPATTKRNKENRDNSPAKNDPKDAAVIADLVGRGYYAPYQFPAPIFARLQVLVKARERLVGDGTRLQNRLHGWLCGFRSTPPSLGISSARGPWRPCTDSRPRPICTGSARIRSWRAGGIRGWPAPAGRWDAEWRRRC